MSEIRKYQQMLGIGMSLFLFVCMLQYICIPQTRQIALGLCLGGGVSWCNTVYLGYKTTILVAKLTAKQPKITYLGFIQRVVSVTFIAVLSIKLPQYISIYAVVGSLLVPGIMLLVLGIYYCGRTSLYK